jgi:hypothetical protein
VGLEAVHESHAGPSNKEMKLTKPRELEWTRLCSLSPVFYGYRDERCGYGSSPMMAFTKRQPLGSALETTWCGLHRPLGVTTPDGARYSLTGSSGALAEVVLRRSGNGRGVWAHGGEEGVASPVSVADGECPPER